MKKIVLGLLLCVSVVDAAPVQSTVKLASRPSRSSTSGNFGLGVMFGEPSGLTVKYWTGSSTALQFGLTYSFNNYLALLADHLWHFKNAFGPSVPTLVPYAGVGAIIGFRNSNERSAFFNRHYDSSLGLGLRIPLGIEFLPARAPLGIFAELVPAVGLIPGSDGLFMGQVGGDIGIRFYL